MAGSLKRGKIDVSKMLLLEGRDLSGSLNTVIGKLTDIRDRFPDIAIEMYVSSSDYGTEVDFYGSRDETDDEWSDRMNVESDAAEMAHYEALEKATVARIAKEKDDLATFNRLKKKFGK